MTSWPILSLVTFLPLVGALFCLIVNGPKEAVERNCRSIAIVTSGVTASSLAHPARRTDRAFWLVGV